MDDNNLSHLRGLYFFENYFWIKIKSKEDEIIQNYSISLKDKLLIEQKGHEKPYSYDKICERLNINSHKSFIEQMDRDWYKVFYKIGKITEI